MNSNRPKKLVKCPQCGADAIYAPENPFRPFCSKRCRLIDLGEWADGNFRIAGENADPAMILHHFEKDEADYTQ